MLHFTREGIFKGKERKALEAQIQQTGREIADKLDKIPDTLKADGYPDVQAFMATYRKMEAVVEQYNRDLAEWERQIKEKGKPKRPPEKESVRDRLRQLQADGKQQRTRKKSQDREITLTPNSTPQGRTLALREYIYP